MWKLFLRVTLPIVLLSFGAAAAWFLMSNPPKPKQQVVVAQMPPVKIQTVHLQTLNIPIYARGMVIPATEVMIVGELPGQVISVSPNLKNGGFVTKGEVLIRVSDAQYRLDVTRAHAQIVSAEEIYAKVQTELSLEDDVKGLQSPQKYRLRKLEEAKSQLAAAQAGFRLAQMQLDRAEIKAPFDGRVREAYLGVGQTIAAGTQIARVYAVNAAEVRLPLSDQQFSLVDAPHAMASGTISSRQAYPEVIFKSNYAGKDYFWKGRVLRTEGGIDAQNRLLNLVAQIEDPYSEDLSQAGRPILAAGQLLEAEISGRSFHQMALLPRSALRNDQEIWVLDAENRLRKKHVEILYKSRDHVYIQSGLTEADRVVVSPLDIAIEGMKMPVENHETSKSRQIVSTPTVAMPTMPTTKASSMVPPATTKTQIFKNQETKNPNKKIPVEN